MNSLGARYAMVAGPGLVATGVSFSLLVAPAGPLWLSLPLLGFGLSLVTSATLRDLTEAHAAHPTLEERAQRARRPANRRRRTAGGRHGQAPRHHAEPASDQSG